MCTRPPVPLCRGTRPSQAANSRPDLKAAGPPIAATTAVAVSTPTPGISAKARSDGRRLRREVTVTTCRQDAAAVRRTN